MPKINQEEYEVLKELDDKWELIARNADDVLWVMESDLLEKSSFYGTWMDFTKKDVEQLKTDLFKFIQWEDDEPYGIAELIEEYEKDRFAELTIEIALLLATSVYDVKQALLQINNSFMIARMNQEDESEETDVKGKKWLLEEVENIPMGQRSNITGHLVISYSVVKDLYQLDEPDYDHATAETVLANAVDKGELSYYGDKYVVAEIPAIPQFVVEWIEKYKDRQYGLGHAVIDAYTHTRLGDWMEGNEETFAKAWVGGYEVEEEQKYYVLNKNESAILVHDTDTEYGDEIAFAENGKLKHVYLGDEKFMFTEQEIKDYDPRYLAFKVPVEELEE